MKQTSIEEIKKISASGEYKLVPVCREILADIRTPLNVLKALKNISHHCFLLESVENSRQWGRYTFLGFDPKMEISCKDSRLTINAGGKVTLRTEHPGAFIKQIIEDNRSPCIPGMPTLTGGLVGYFSYDYIQYAEPELHLKKADSGFPDVDLMLFDKLIVFDNLRQKIILIVNIHTGSIDTEYNGALVELDKMEEIVRNGNMTDETGGKLLSELRPALDREEFCKRIGTIKEHIREGDIFQLVYSNPLRAKFRGSLLDTYRILRTTNPSPYMFYFSGDCEIAGASPETLVKVEGRTIRTFPLAGTRPRGKTEAEDKALERELLSDRKEIAEHNMLVDLGRNDLGRLCEFGSVRVEEYMSVEKYSHVMHIGSTVQGKMRRDIQPVDVIDSVLPAGTLSGAPKFRACQIIDKLEDDRRGLYGGAIGYVDFSGNLDVCIAIRLVYKKDEEICIRSGAGIVADSIPENEYQECINKAKAVVEALKEAEGLQG